GGHIVLEIDESLGLARIAIRRQFAAAYAIADEITGHGIIGGLRLVARIAGGGGTRFRAFAKRGSKVEIAIARTGTAAFLGAFARQINLASLIPDQRAFRVREQM